MSREGVDYAWWSPSEQELARIGARFVIRYLSPDSSKNLTRGEAERHAAAGRDIGVVWEAGGSGALGSRGLGQDHAHQAIVQAINCGMVGAYPIPAAVDFDTAGHPERTDAYFDGWADVLGHARTGPYGGYEVVRHQMNRGFGVGFQTYAWSGGRLDPRAQWYQHDNSPGEYDWDREIHPGLLWRPGVPKHHTSPLDVLLPSERAVVNHYEDLVRHHPRFHPHAIAKVRAQLVTLRKSVWLAASKGLLPNGKPTKAGWDQEHRAARYRVLWSLTK